jgi:hypothetical protein
MRADLPQLAMLDYAVATSFNTKSSGIRTLPRTFTAGSRLSRIMRSIVRTETPKLEAAVRLFITNGYMQFIFCGGEVCRKIEIIRWI